MGIVGIIGVMKTGALRTCLATGIVLSVSVAAAAEPEPDADVPPITLRVQGAQLRDVLSGIAEFAKINLVMPGDVRGRVTVTLRDVPWETALAVIARSHGLGFFRRDNVVYVDHLDRLAAYDEALVRRKSAAQAARPLVTRIIRLSYARAEALAPLIETLLSDRGSVIVDRRTNTLIITDVAERVAKIRGRVGR